MADPKIVIDFNIGEWRCGDGCCSESWWWFEVMIDGKCVYESHEITWYETAAEVAVDWMNDNGYEGCVYDVEVSGAWDGYVTANEIREAMEEYDAEE